jgi:hypothetical protein
MVKDNLPLKICLFYKNTLKKTIETIDNLFFICFYLKTNCENKKKHRKILKITILFWKTI